MCERYSDSLVYYLPGEQDVKKFPWSKFTYEIRMQIECVSHAPLLLLYFIFLLQLLRSWWKKASKSQKIIMSDTFVLNVFKKKHAYKLNLTKCSNWLKLIKRHHSLLIFWKTWLWLWAEIWTFWTVHAKMLKMEETKHPDPPWRTLLLVLQTFT